MYEMSDPVIFKLLCQNLISLVDLENVDNTNQLSELISLQHIFCLYCQFKHLASFNIKFVTWQL